MTARIEIIPPIFPDEEEWLDAYVPNWKFVCEEVKISRTGAHYYTYIEVPDERYVVLWNLRWP
jgi:hypothetical protein